MEPPFTEDTPTRTERILAQYVSVCARISQSDAKPAGQRVPSGKLEKLIYERSRLQLDLNEVFEGR